MSFCAESVVEEGAVELDRSARLSKGSSIACMNLRIEVRSEPNVMQVNAYCHVCNGKFYQQEGNSFRPGEGVNRFRYGEAFMIMKKLRTICVNVGWSLL